MKKTAFVACMLLSCFLFSAQAQTSSTPRDNSEDPDNLAKEYFSQIMGVAASSTTNTKIAVEDFRYPLKNEKTNMNNTPSSVQRDIDRFLMSLNVNATIDYSNNTLYITIE